MSDWKEMDTAPMDGTEIIVFDGFAVSVAVYDADTTFGDFLTFCDDGEGEAEWLEYLEENPGMGWMSRETRTGDYVFMEPVAWMDMPKPPALAPIGKRTHVSEGLFNQ